MSKIGAASDKLARMGMDSASNTLSAAADDFFKYLFVLSGGHEVILQIDSVRTKHLEEIEAAGFVIFHNDENENVVVTFSSTGLKLIRTILDV